ncbi:hypothetical protein H4R33_002047 [Dimargaris cristalligena]|nr:hypothetical protein H4R33_002047 [Dimargaris cristalligena]
MSMITYEGGSAYAILDPSKPKAVVIIQEWWGLNQHMKNLARRFADQGFQAIVPDLYHGKVTTDAQEATHLMGNLNWPGAVAEIQAAVDFLRLPAQGARFVSVVGFCMGGALTAAAAVKVRGLVAAAPFYGTPPAALGDPAETQVPVEAHFGKLDTHRGFADPAAAQAYSAKVEQAGVPHHLYMYDAGHAFMNETRPEAFDPEAAKLAFQRVVNFFNRYSQ